MKKLKGESENTFIFGEDYEEVFSENKTSKELENDVSGSDFVQDSEFDLKSDTSNRNYTDVSSIAYMAIKFEVSPRAAAALVNAALVDLNIVRSPEEGKMKFIDPKKIERKVNQINACNIKLRNNNVSGTVTAIQFDGKGDKSFTMKRIGNRKVKYRSETKVDHYSVTADPSGQFLTQFIAPKGPTTEELQKDPEKPKKGKLTAEVMLHKLESIGVDRNKLVVAGSDSTTLNTGPDGGIIRWLEFFLQRCLLWIICLYHLLELPFRSLLKHKKMLGKPLSGYKFGGPIGELLDNVTNLPYNENFEPLLEVESEIPNLSEEVLKELSWDQLMLYKLTKMILTGVKEPNIEDYSIGPVSLARWLTIGSRLLRLYISKHNLNEEETQKLRLLVEYIVIIYTPTWFDIKIKPYVSHGSHHYFKMIQRLSKIEFYDSDLLDAVKKNMVYNSYWMHSESILQTMLCSEDRNDRKFAIDTIMKIRKNEDFGSCEVRSRVNPKKLNFEATSLKDVLDPDQYTIEPPLTIYEHSDDLKKYIDAPMILVKWHCHSQNNERCVQQVSKAGEVCCTEDKIEGLVLSNQVANSMVGKVNSKQDFLGLTEKKTYLDTVKKTVPDPSTYVPKLMPKLTPKP